MQKIEYVVEEAEKNNRIDVYLCSKLDGFSRSKVQKIIEDGNVFVNDKIVKPKKMTEVNDVVTVVINDPTASEILPESDVAFDIIYEDEYFAVINKPQGLIVHPSNNILTGTLVNGLLSKLSSLSGINGEMRPGIVHRIDKDTSGLLVVAKCDMAHNSLAKQIEAKTCKRIYKAINCGVFREDCGTITTYIGRSPVDRKKMAVVKVGKHAITDFKVLQRFENYTLTEFSLKTGRTHQIRVHSKHIGHPILGDLTYNGAKNIFNLKGQLLHAYKLILVHPKTLEEMTFISPLPNYFEEVLNILGQNNLQ